MHQPDKPISQLSRLFSSQAKLGLQKWHCWLTGRRPRLVLWLAAETVQFLTSLFGRARKRPPNHPQPWLRIMICTVQQPSSNVVFGGKWSQAPKRAAMAMNRSGAGEDEPPSGDRAAKGYGLHGAGVQTSGSGQLLDGPSCPAACLDARVNNGMRLEEAQPQIDANIGRRVALPRRHRTNGCLSFSRRQPP
jgi:hypothetical protein